MMNQSHAPIMEELHAHRSGKIMEQVNRSVTSAVDKFFHEQKTPSQVKKRINNLLNFIYLKCNEFGKNTFVGGTSDYTKGDMEDYGGPESGPDPRLTPSIYEVVFQVKFDNGRQDFNKLYGELLKLLQKEAKANFTEIEADAFAITMTIDCTMDDLFGYYICIDKSNRGFTVRVGNQVNPFTNESVNESGPKSVKSVKYFKGQKPWDKFKFEFIPFTDKCGKSFLKVNMRNEYWDSGDYAFIDVENPEVTNIHSYSKEASNTVLKALKAAGYKKSTLQDIIKELKITPIPEEFKKKELGHFDDIKDAPYIQKRKDIEPEDKEESGSDSKKNDDDDSDESSTGVFGTEIGLPIDKENCESTDVSGVSTPTGTLNPQKKVKGISEGMDSSDTRDLTIQCPECGSQSINVRDADIFHCADCGYEWEVEYDEEEQERLQRDTMLDNSQDEKPLTFNQYKGNPLENIYTNPQSDSRLHESVASATDLKSDLFDAISKSGDIEYNGSDYVEVRASKNPISSIESILKKKYKVKKANNRLSVDGGDEFHYIEIIVKSKTGHKDIFIVDFDIPI